MEIPEPVRRLAVRPFHELPTPPDTERVDLDGAFVAITRWPMAQVVGILGDGPSDVAATVQAARDVARDRGKTILGWWVPPEQDHVAPALEAAGLINEDTPGFESVENALALTEPPAGDRVDGVDVREVESWEDYRLSSLVAEEAFGLPPTPEDDLRARYDEYLHPDNPGRLFSASIDGRIVGTSFAAFGDVGVNLFGGSVLPDARGRGVYRALVLARWDAARQRGTAALTVQAGRMSRPICERLGFEFVAPVRVYVDQL
jgi:GNAT superfamily N-acetyltransferase